jgi:hypothetical protein
MTLRLTRLGLLPLSIFLWAVGVSQTNVTHLGALGLPPSLPLVFYAGLAVLVASAGFEFSRPRLSQVRLGLHAISLVVILYGTAPLVYQTGRYAWLYKAIGVVQYVSANGSLNRSIDIYQNWPGFFAIAAWFDKVAGASSPLDYAKWAQLAFELAAVPLLYTIYKSLSLSVWHRWLAIMLYAGSNWVAQDYYSPQGMSTLLSLGIMALVARWMFVASEGSPLPRWASGLGARLTSITSRAHNRTQETVGDESAFDIDDDGHLALIVGRSAPFITTLVLLFAVLTVSHELSPYIVAIQIMSLAIPQLARPRWVAVAVVVIAFGYLAPNFTFVNSHYGITSSIGSFFSNVQPPSSSQGAKVSGSHRIIADCSFLLSLGVWCLSLTGAWLRRKSGRIVPALLLLTFTPILVLLGGAYGNEGILRVYLFSLPWAVALAVYALAPIQGQIEDGGHGTLRAVAPLTLAVALFLPAFFGDDASNVMPASEVTAITEFLDTAKPGPVLEMISNAPTSDNPDYDQFPVGTVFGSQGAIASNQQIPDLSVYLARTMKAYSPGEPAYIIMAPSMTAFNEAYGTTRRGEITLLLTQLVKSRYWTLVVDHDGTEIYQLSAAATRLSPGPHSSTLVLGVA